MSKCNNTRYVACSGYSKQWAYVPVRLYSPGLFSPFIRVLQPLIAFTCIQCTDLSVTPKSGTPPFTLTVCLNSMTLPDETEPADLRSLLVFTLLTISHPTPWTPSTGQYHWFVESILQMYADTEYTLVVGIPILSIPR